MLGIVALSLAQHRRALREGRGTDGAEYTEPSAALEASSRGRGSFLRLPGVAEAQRTAEHAEHQLIDWSKVVRV